MKKVHCSSDPSAAAAAMHMAAPTLVLGSSSQWRRSLFFQHFAESSTARFMSPDIDEKAIRHRDPETLTLLIANAKADALVQAILSDDPSANCLLICMDQVVVCEGEIREKPQDEAEVRRYLASYSAGSAAQCVNGVCVHNLQTGRRVATNALASVRFAPLPTSVVDAAILDGKIFTSAGAFAIEHPLFSPYVADIDGTRDVIQGLPVAALRALLADASAPAPAASPTSPVCRRGLSVRVLQPRDEDEARRLIAAGMEETIVAGLRTEYSRLAPERCAAVLALGAIGAISGPSIHPILTWDSSALLVGALCATLLAGLISWHPKRIAREYVRQCLATDLRDPSGSYLSRRGSCFWVAIDKVTARSGLGG